MASSQAVYCSADFLCLWGGRTCSTEAAIKARESASGSEQFDEVAGGVSEQDLASAGAADDVAAKW